MRTSLNEIKEIERYLHRALDPEDALLFEAKTLTQPELQQHVQLQRRVFSLVKLFHRQRMKHDLETIHQHLFRDPGKKTFQEKIFQLFKS